MAQPAGAGGEDNALADFHSRLPEKEQLLGSAGAASHSVSAPRPPSLRRSVCEHLRTRVGALGEHGRSALPL